MLPPCLYSTHHSNAAGAREFRRIRRRNPPAAAPARVNVGLGATSAPQLLDTVPAAVVGAAPMFRFPEPISVLRISACGLYARIVRASPNGGLIVDVYEGRRSMSVHTAIHLALLTAAIGAVVLAANMKLALRRIAARRLITLPRHGKK